MNYTKEQLYELSIYEVRKIGQLEGVKSPTSLKKDELINEILAISSGVKERYVPTNKKGRPSKSFKDIDFLRAFEEEKKEAKKSFFDSSMEVCAQSLDEDAFYKMAAEPAGDFEGFVDILSGGFGIIKEKLNSENFIYLTNSLIKKANLKKGDFVKVSTLKLGNGKVFANELISKPKLADRGEFVEVEAIYPSKTIKFENNAILNSLAPIGCGQRVAIVGDDENLIENVVFNLFNSTSLNKVLVIFGAQPEEKQKFKNNENIVCVDDNLNSAILAANMLHRKAEEGQDCILFVLGAHKFNFNNEISDGEIAKAFKNTKQAGSVTLIAGITQECKNAFSQIFNLVLELDEKLCLYGIGFPIDVDSLSLFRKDEIFTAESAEKIRQSKLAKLKSIEELVNYLNSLK